MDGAHRAESAFEKHEVVTVLNKVPISVDKLEARLEGRDLQDLDDLVEYTRDQINALPPNLKSKVIGTVQTPMSYDRSILRRVRGDLEDTLNKAKRFETASLDRQLRNMLVVLGIWEIIVFALTLAVGVPAASSFDPGVVLVIFGAAILLGLIGMALLPIRGYFLQSAYSNRMFALKEDYLKILRDALKEIVGYGANLRRSTASPYIRLVESQTQLTDELKTELDNAEQAILRIQRGLSVFG